jgi:uncharacterized membrane protein HdeD (DUF308 family)
MNERDRKRLKSGRNSSKGNVLVPRDESQDLKAMLLAFFAIASVIGGAMNLVTFWRDDSLTDYWFIAVLGVLILTSGLTVLWMKSRFCRR